MKDLARANLTAGPPRSTPTSRRQPERATINLEVRAAQRQHELRRENDAFLAMRRVSFDQVHHRRIRRLNDALATNLERGNTRVIPASRARITKQEARYENQLSVLAARVSLPHTQRPRRLRRRGRTMTHQDLPLEKARNTEYLQLLKAKLARPLEYGTARSRTGLDPKPLKGRTYDDVHPLIGRVGLDR